jgi:hypothetical protein
VSPYALAGASSGQDAGVQISGRPLTRRLDGATACATVGVSSCRGIAELEPPQEVRRHGPIRLGRFPAAIPLLEPRCPLSTPHLAPTRLSVLPLSRSPLDAGLCPGPRRHSPALLQTSSSPAKDVEEVGHGTRAPYLVPSLFAR